MAKKSRWCDRTLIQNPYHFTLCLTDKSFRRELKRIKLPQELWPARLIPGSHASLHGFLSDDGRTKFCILGMTYDCSRSPEEVVGLLAHEATHLWQWIKGHLGEKNPSPEFEAYSIQNITQSLYSEYQRQTK